MIKKTAASLAFATAFFCTQAQALNSVSTADCVAEQKQFLDLHVGGYYKENVENVNGSIRYINQLLAAGATDYLRAIDKQRVKNEKLMMDHVNRWGRGDLPRGVQLDITSDILTICFTRARLGLPPAQPFTGLDPTLLQKQARAEEKPVTQKSELPTQKAPVDGNRFLAENSKKPGVKTTASGLQYEVQREGQGPRPTAKDRVTVHYKGTLTNGQTFDSSYERGQPVTFALAQVIPGWTEGVQLMSVGSKYKFYIPSRLGYGEQGIGPIPPNSTLIFEVELFGIR